MIFPTGSILSSNIVTKSPKPTPGIIFKTFASRLTTLPSNPDNGSYFSSPSLYPIKPPVLSFTLVTLTVPVTAQSSISTLPFTLPENAPVAKLERSFNLASSKSSNAFDKLKSTPVRGFNIKLSAAPSPPPILPVKSLIKLGGDVISVAELFTDTSFSSIFFTLTVEGPPSFGVMVAKKPTP